jgi:hypothetical protein
MDVAIQGNYAYLAIWGVGLRVLDITVPGGPTAPYGGCYTTGNPTGIALVGNRAYLAAGDAGLVQCSISNPNTPWVRWTVNTPGSANDVAIGGSYAYVADGAFGLQVIETTTPTGPIASVATAGYSWGVHYAGGYAYMASGNAGLEIINVSNPLSPSLVATVPLAGSAHGVFVYQGYAYVCAGGSGVAVVDVSDPTHPVLVVTCGTPSIPGPSDMVVAGGYAYVADAEAGLAILHIIPPYSPLAALQSPSLATSLVTVDGVDDTGLAYLACGLNGVKVVQVSDVAYPDDPVRVGSNAAIGTVTDVAVVPENVIYATNSTGLSILSGTDPTNPYTLGSIATPGSALAVAPTTISGSRYALIADGDAGLTVAWTRTPASPTIKGSTDTTGWATEVAAVTLNGVPYACVADGVTGLRLMNLTTPSAPIEVGFYNTPGRAVGVSVSGTRAYVADGQSGVRVVDISTPASPQEIGYYDTSGWAESVAALGNWALVADGDAGVALLDFSMPTAPVYFADYQTPGWASDVSVLGSCAYVADTGWGLEILALWNSFPDVPFFHWSYTNIEAAVSHAIVQGYTDGLFHPDYAVSRDQIAVFIARADTAGVVPVYAGTPHFTDVPADYWSYNEVEYCYGAGIITGYTATTYLPRQIVSRADMAVFMARAMGWVTVGDDMTTAPDLFYDILAGFWAGTAIEACVDNGVVQGYPDGFFHPTWDVSRDQMTVFLGRTYGY